MRKWLTFLKRWFNSGEDSSPQPSLAASTAELLPEYEEMFLSRGGCTPEDPLVFHLHHLALYWSRLRAFCQKCPESAEGMIEGHLGACVQIASCAANMLVERYSRVYESWTPYWKKTQAVLHARPVTGEDVEEASALLDECLKAIGHDPWDRTGIEVVA